MHVDFAARLATNDLSLLRHATLSGLGIASLPGFQCKDDLAQGRLLEVLPGWHSTPLDFHALFSDPRGIVHVALSAVGVQSGPGVLTGGDFLGVYVSDPEASVARPDAELKAFARVELDAIVALPD